MDTGEDIETLIQRILGYSSKEVDILLSIGYTTGDGQRAFTMKHIGSRQELCRLCRMQWESLKEEAKPVVSTAVEEEDTE